MWAQGDGNGGGRAPGGLVVVESTTPDGNRPRAQLSLTSACGRRPADPLGRRSVGRADHRLQHAPQCLNQIRARPLPTVERLHADGGHSSICISSFCSCIRELLLLTYYRTQVVCRNARKERRLFVRMVSCSQLILLEQDDAPLRY